MDERVTLRSRAPGLREAIDSRTRPGQPEGTLVVDRAPSAATLSPRGHMGANRYDWTDGENHESALYGRGRYGTGRYAGA
ncbi:MAG: hypothetical protein U9R79_05320 [Armatimonadota bacterium]|nr:hypothetical protein [Armatimonadota bacterium]